MSEQLQPTTTLDSAWLLLHPRAAFRFRQPNEEECRIAGVQDPDAVAIVAKSCDGDFLIVASGRATPDSGAVERLVETLGLPAAMGAQLATHLPRVRPNTLALAAARLMRSAPWCEGCRCAVRWTVMLAGLALESAPHDAPGLSVLESEWSELKMRSGPPTHRISDAPVVAASAALREIAGN